MNRNAPELSPEEERRRSRSLRAVFIGIIVTSLVLGSVLFYNYSKFLSFVNDSLEERDEPFPWESAEHTPVEACVDHTLDWSSRCVGVKTLCDEYVTRVINLCLGAESRLTYCRQFEREEFESTKFGHHECVARGVRRNVDSEACSKAYRAVTDWCRYELDKATWEANQAEASTPNTEDSLP